MLYTKYTGAKILCHHLWNQNFMKNDCVLEYWFGFYQRFWKNTVYEKRTLGRFTIPIVQNEVYQALHYIQYIESVEKYIELLIKNMEANTSICIKLLQILRNDETNKPTLRPLQIAFHERGNYELYISLHYHFALGNARKGELKLDQELATFSSRKLLSPLSNQKVPKN